MKKRGLIVSTIVMVVVLAVAITTATYAWFSSQAKAEISNINVRTQASSGLQIAAWDGTNYTSGDLAYANDKWSGTGGWGPELNMAAQSQRAAFYGVSGNGYSMLTAANLTANLYVEAEELVEGTVYYEDEDGTVLASDDSYFEADGTPLVAISALDWADEIANNGATVVYQYDSSTYAEDGNAVVGTKPEYLTTAAPNANYLLLNFALYNQAAIDDIIVKNLTVAPVANSRGYNNMAASLRIALFASTSVDDNAFALSDQKMIFDPYGNMVFTEAAQTWSAAGGKTGVKWQAPLAGATGRAYSAATSNALTAFVGTSVLSVPNVFETVTYTATKLGEAYKLALQVAGNSVLYCRLVIWFEGEDPACIPMFAGGGADVTIEFGRFTDLG